MPKNVLPMDIAAGYKMTEVGIIPEDWKIVTIGDVINVFDGTHQTPHYVDVGVPFYSVENLTANNFTNTKFISEEEHALLTKKVKIEKGDVLMTRIGSVGDCKFIDWDVNASYYVSLALLKKKSDNISMKWFASMSKSTAFKESILSNSLQFAVPMKINLGEISKVKFAMPSIEEQNLIADKLVEFDDFVSKIESQISKKKKIKEGTMQQLLTGKKRLPGFDGEWVEIKLGKIADIRTGKRNGDENVEFGRYPFFVRSQTVYRINSYSYDGEAILVPGEGGIGSIFHYINGKFDFHQRVYKISDFNENVAAKFIFYYMKKFFGPYAMMQSVKATVDSLRLPTFQEFDISMPKTKEEQIAIANILSDMEEEIKTLEEERDKYLLIKQGMMQDLLTGKTRLV